MHEDHAYDPRVLDMLDAVPLPDHTCREDMLRWDLKAARQEISQLMRQLDSALWSMGEATRARNIWRRVAYGALVALVFACAAIAGLVEWGI